MSFLLNSSDQSKFASKYVFLDNDFLSVIFEDEGAFDIALEFLKTGFLTIDPFTKFEFLRDVYLPEARDIKEKFISNETVFKPIDDHQEIFRQIKENALILSRLYSHNKKAGVGTIDLLLAAQLMKFGNRSVFVTGNKKHFPPFIFDTLSVMNYEDETGNMRVFCVLQFNESKFNDCIANYNRMGS